MSIVEILWTVIFGLLWFIVAIPLVKSAWTGDFGYWMQKAGARRTPALRSISPARFWLRWIALAVPFLGLPLFAAIGLLSERAN